MEKRNKETFEKLLGKEVQPIKNEIYWEETERGKSFNLLIPAPILEMELSNNEKIVLGFIYSMCNIGGYMNMSYKRIANYLNLSNNTISTTMKQLVELTFIQKTDKGYILSNEVVEAIDLRKERTILLPFEIFNSKLNAGAKILWGEYNSISKGKKPYYASRQYTAKRLHMNKSSISSWTTLLKDKQFLTHELYSEYKFRKKVVITTIFERSKTKDYNEDVEE